MPYIYKFTKELEQFGLCSFKLNLTDSDSIFPELNIPVVFRDGEYNEEVMHELAMRLIVQETPIPEPIIEEQPTEEPTEQPTEQPTEEPVVEEFTESPIVEEQPTEQPIVEEPIVEEQL